MTAACAYRPSVAEPSERIAWSVDQVELEPHHHVLEVGCGHGVAVALLAERVPKGRVVAVDRSTTMVGAARNRSAALVKAGRVEVVEGTFGQLGWDEARFDHVFSLNVIAVADRADACLPEARRVLRPAGRLWWAMQDPPGSEGEPRSVAALTAALPCHGFELVRSCRELLADGSRIALLVARRI